MVFHNLPDRTRNALILGHTVTEVPSTLALFGNEHGAREMMYQEKGPVAKIDALSFNPVIHMLEKENSRLQVVLLTPHMPSYTNTKQCNKQEWTFMHQKDKILLEWNLEIRKQFGHYHLTC